MLLKSVAELPGAELWVAMVQREVADRLAAPPGGKSYGATSVLAQLACEVRVLRKVPRTVFHPEPNVDSALVVLRRRGPARHAELVALVHAGFAHRRKALAGIAGADAGRTRRHPRRRLARRSSASATPPTRARSGCAPGEWPRLADALGRERLASLRPAVP